MVLLQYNPHLIGMPSRGKLGEIRIQPGFHFVRIKKGTPGKQGVFQIRNLDGHLFEIRQRFTDGLNEFVTQLVGQAPGFKELLNMLFHLRCEQVINSFPVTLAGNTDAFNKGFELVLVYAPNGLDSSILLA